MPRENTKKEAESPFCSTLVTKLHTFTSSLCLAEHAKRHAGFTSTWPYVSHNRPWPWKQWLLEWRHPGRSNGLKGKSIETKTFQETMSDCRTGPFLLWVLWIQCWLLPSTAENQPNWGQSIWAERRQNYIEYWIIPSKNQLQPATVNWCLANPHAHLQISSLKLLGKTRAPETRAQTAADNWRQGFPQNIVDLTSNLSYTNCG